MTRPLRVVHIITGLGSGGAEAMLVEVARGLQARGVAQQVVSLLPGGANERLLTSAGIPVRTLAMSKRAPDPRVIGRLRRWLRRATPDIVQTWLYQADVVGGIAAAGLPGVQVVWGVHNTTLPPGARLATRAAVALCARMSSRLPARTVVCSRAAFEHHASLGYPSDRMEVIENGVDTERFRPDAEARRRLRQELGASSADVLVALPARFSPEKDHATFLEAVRLLRRMRPDVRAVVCGEGTHVGSLALEELARIHGVTGPALLRLGRRDDMPHLFAALDVVCLSSMYEAFGLVLCEAMAVGVPCAATDVGASARILGQADLIAPPRDPAALAAVLGRLVDLGPEGRRLLGLRLRQRVVENFSLEQTVDRYEALYRKLKERSRDGA